MIGIIESEKLISLESADYEDSQGFFFRCTGAGNINYLPIGNSESIVGAFTADPTFNNKQLCRKILKDSTTATGIYVGKSM
jgi:hypothetical protein